MGYRSDVAYTVRFTPNDNTIKQEELKGSFEVFLAQVMNDPETAQAFNDVGYDGYPMEGLRIDRERCAINYFVTSVKWYDDYEDVKCHEAILQTARDWIAEENIHSKHLGYAFARVGEDMEDNVEDIGGNAEYDWVGVTRQVICDWV